MAWDGNEHELMNERYLLLLYGMHCWVCGRPGCVMGGGNETLPADGAWEWGGKIRELKGKRRFYVKIIKEN